MFQEYRPRRQPQGHVSLDEILLLQKLNLALDERRHDRNTREADNPHDVVDIGLEGCDDKQDEHEAWEGIDKVGEIGNARVELATPVAGSHTEHRAEKKRNKDGQEAG